MIIDIPKRNAFSQSNDGELGGTLSRTFNVDFEQERGKVTLSRRMNLNTSVADEANLTVPTAFTFFDDRYFAVAGGTVYKSDSDTKGDPSVEMSPDTSTGTPTGLSSDDDIILFNGRPYLAAGSLYKKNGTTDGSDWVDTGITFSGGFHSTCVYADRLYWSELSDNISSINTSDVRATTENALDLGNSKLDISVIRAASDGIWIGTVNTEGGRGRVYKWDGVTLNTTDAVYDIPDVGVKSLIIHENRPYIVTSRGLIMVFNGSYFQEITRFPFYYDIKSLFQREDRNGWIHDNSVAIIDNKIHMLIANDPLDNGIDINDNNRSYGGVWVLDPDVGLYHKYAFYTGSSTSSDVITQVDIVNPGAIYPAGVDVNLLDFEDVGKFICGAEYYSDATTSTHGIFSVQSKYEEGTADSYDTYPSVGWFVTSQIQASEIMESWANVVLTCKEMANTDDKFVIKARSNERTVVDTTITWTSTTTFTSTDTDWATIKTNFDADIDYEVTILRGKGGGMCSHITAVTEDGGTYTVTVDETHTGATSGTAKARLEQWVKLGSIDGSQTEMTFDRFATNINSTWIQYKVFMKGKGANPVLEGLASVSGVHTNY